MYLSFSVRATVLALICLFASVAPAFAATSTGAVLIPGIISEYPTSAPKPAPAPVVAAPKPVVSAPVVSKPAVVTPVTKTRTLSRGMRGSDVLLVQNLLIALSFLPKDSATGYFGPLTETAIKNFQIKNNIVSSGGPSSTGYGAVGPRTRAVFASGQSIGNGTAGSSAAASNPAPAGTSPANVPTQDFTPLIPVPGFTAINTPRPCVFNNQLVVSGTGVFAYASDSVAYGAVCSSELRMCTDGQLSGTYSYAACAQSAPPAQTPPDTSNVNSNTNISTGANTPAACAWGASIVSSGNSVTAYQSASAVYGGQCVSESRTCNNGSLSGTYQYASCSVDTPLSCTFNGQTIAHGGVVTGYQSSSVAAGGSCASQQRTCVNGTLSGSYQFGSCTVLATTSAPPTSCAFNGTTVPSGAAIQAYQSANVPYGTTCASQQRTCTNGQLSGTYTYSSCQVSAPVSCTFNGSTVGNGVGITAYQASSVAYGASCTSEIRNCSNGTLSGTYQYASCSVAAPTACTLNGQTIANGTTVAAFQNSVVSAGGSCVPQARTCTNGSLSGSSAYAYDRCAVQSNSAPLPNMYVPTTYNGIGLQLQAWYATPSGSGPYPVIILAHGCNGLNPDYEKSDWTHQNSWASLMREWGYATLIVDSFTARGYPNGVCSNGNAVNGLDHALDVYAAATMLAKTSGVNPQKIGVFGSSHGGNAVEITMTTNRPSTQSAYNAMTAAGGRIAGGASLYPICDPIGSYSYYSPLFVAAGADDNWDSPAVCKSLTNYPTVKNSPVDLNAYGALMRMIVYQNATHAFDVPGPTTVVTDANGHTFAYNPSATADLQSRIRTFFDSFVR